MNETVVSKIAVNIYKFRVTGFSVKQNQHKMK